MDWVRERNREREREIDTQRKNRKPPRTMRKEYYFLKFSTILT